MYIILNEDDRLDPREHFDPRLIGLFADTHLGFAKICDELKDPPGAAPA